jgi:hypothetical protein
MSVQLETQPVFEESDPMRLEDLGYHFRQRPFLANRMTQPREGFLDVPGIQQKEFAALLQAAQESLENGTATGIVVWGEPGIGKSHLLARLEKWCEEGNAWCILLQNIHASPGALPSYMLKCAIGQLTLGRRELFRSTPLYKIIEAVIRAFCVGNRNLAHPAFKRFADDWTKRCPEHQSTDWKILKVLWMFFKSSYHSNSKPADDKTARLAIDWLTGEHLEKDELTMIDLDVLQMEGESEEADDDHVLRVLVIVTELARAARRPFLLCLDQVDVLNDERMRALATFLHILLDSSRNLLTIFCGVQEMILKHISKQTIAGADWDRICQAGKIELPRLDGEGTRHIMQKRMENFLEPLKQSPAVWACAESDWLFPLGDKWLARRLREVVDPRPRQVISWAHQRWLEQEKRIAEMGPEKWLKAWELGNGIPANADLTPALLFELIDKKLEERIAEHCSRVELNPSILPPDASHLLGLLDALVEQCNTSPQLGAVKVQTPPAKKGCKPAFDRVIQFSPSDSAKERTVGVVAICTVSRSSMAWALGRLVSPIEPPESVILLVDGRRPLNLAKKGQEYYDTLFAVTNRGKYQKVELGLQELAQLDALQKVINDARAGDLEIDLPDGTSRALTEDDVIASHVRKDRYLSHPLVKRIFASTERSDVVESTEEITVDPFSDGDLRQFILAQLALTMGMTASGLAARFAEERKIDDRLRSGLKASMITVSMQMHKEKLLYATPCDDDLSLLL